MSRNPVGRTSYRPGGTKSLKLPVLRECNARSEVITITGLGLPTAICSPETLLIAASIFSSITSLLFFVFHSASNVCTSLRQLPHLLSFFISEGRYNRLKVSFSSSHDHSSDPHRLLVTEHYYTDRFSQDNFS